MQDIVSSAQYDMTALYTASFKSDVAAIKRAALLKVNPNIQHKESGYTALHMAVIRYFTFYYSYLRILKIHFYTFSL